MHFNNISRQRNSERMSDKAFKFMNFIFKIVDFIYPHIDKRIASFGIGQEMAVVDYGCGPGRNTLQISKLVGDPGLVHEADIHKLGIAEIKKKIDIFGLKNVEPVLIAGYSS